MAAPQANAYGRLLPKLVTVFQEGYSVKGLARDLMSGLIVGIVALPLAIAFAIASGVKPEQGLYTAIIAGFLISVFGGSRVQIGGPTGAFIVVVYGVVQQHGYAGLATATLIAGVLLVLMGIARLGAVIQFVPYPVTVGFTSGIALIIASSQVRDFLGLEMETVPAQFIEKVRAYAHCIDTINPWAAAIAAFTAAFVWLWPRVTHRVPGPLLAILVATLATAAFDLPVDTIGKRFGAVPDTLPSLRIPDLDLATIRAVFKDAWAIALLGGIESLLSAVVADGMLGSRHRSNMELVAQGIANIASPLFGGIPATGAIARTATNVKNGGRTPIAGITHALVLLLIMLFFGRWAALIPISTLAGILMVVAYNMSEWHVFVKLFRSPPSDVLVLLVTFLLTVLVDLAVALEVGIVLAALLFMRRMANLTSAGFVTKMLREENLADDPNAIEQREVPAGVEVFEIYGAFFFGAASRCRDAMGQIEKPARLLILRLREVNVIDATGLRALEDIVDRCRRHGTQLLLSGVHAQPMVVMEKAGLLDKVGRDNLCADIDDALAIARERLGLVAAPPP